MKRPAEEHAIILHLPFCILSLSASKKGVLPTPRKTVQPGAYEEITRLHRYRQAFPWQAKARSRQPSSGCGSRCRPRPVRPFNTLGSVWG